MATKIPFPSEQGNPITPSGRFNESWRQFFLALRDITQNVTPFDPGPLTVRINELVQNSQAVVPVPVFPRGNTPEDGLVPLVYRDREPEEGTVVFTHGIQDQPDLHAVATQTQSGFLSSTDKVKLDGLSATTEDIFQSGSGFTGGTTTSLTLSKAYASPSAVLVHFDGTFQGSDQYNVSGNTITFNSAIPLGISTVYARG